MPKNVHTTLALMRSYVESSRMLVDDPEERSIVFIFDLKGTQYNNALTTALHKLFKGELAKYIDTVLIIDPNSAIMSLVKSIISAKKAFDAMGGAFDNFMSRKTVKKKSETKVVCLNSEDAADKQILKEYMPVNTTWSTKSINATSSSLNTVRNNSVVITQTHSNAGHSYIKKSNSIQAGGHTRMEPSTAPSTGLMESQRSRPLKVPSNMYIHTETHKHTENHSGSNPVTFDEKIESQVVKGTIETNIRGENETISYKIRTAETSAVLSMEKDKVGLDSKGASDERVSSSVSRDITIESVPTNSSDSNTKREQSGMDEGMLNQTKIVDLNNNTEECVDVKSSDSSLDICQTMDISSNCDVSYGTDGTGKNDSSPASASTKDYNTFISEMDLQSSNKSSSSTSGSVCENEDSCKVQPRSVVYENENEINILPNQDSLTKSRHSLCSMSTQNTDGDCYEVYKIDGKHFKGKTSTKKHRRICGFDWVFSATAKWREHLWNTSNLPITDEYDANTANSLSVML